MSKGGGGGTQTVQKSDPWSGVQPYLTGTGGTTTRTLREGVQPIYGTGPASTADLSPAEQFRASFTQSRLGPEAGGAQQLINPPSDYVTTTTGGTPGIFPEAGRLYSQALGQGYIGQTPEQTGITRDISAELRQAATDPSGYAGVWGAGREALAGRYDPKLGAVRDVAKGDVDLTAARAAQGVLDPTQQLQQILSGQVDTTGLDALQQAAANRAMVGYGDALTDAQRMFTEQMTPAIRGGAQVAGQYGGTRQGIAEGIASRGIGEQLARSARDLGLGSMDIGTQLYADAARRAAEQKYGVATGLGQQAADVATGNVNREQQRQQFQAQMDFNRNQQELARAQQALQARTVGTGMLGQAAAGQAGLADTLYGMAGRAPEEARAAQQFPMQQLGQYASIIQPGSGIGGTSTSTSTGGGTSPLTSGLGSALTAGGLAQAGGLFGSAATATAPAVAASPWAWPLVGGAGILGMLGG